MKSIIASALIIISSCNTSQSMDTEPIKLKNDKFQALLDSADLNGAIVIYDAKQNTYTSNDFKWAETGFLPASTFKIPNTLIALETSVLRDENTVVKWNGEQHWMESWNKDLTLKEAFHASCVPCFQEIARKIGVERMNRYLKAFNYPEMFVDSTNIDMFWLNGKGRISPLQQIAFLKLFNDGGLPMKTTTYTTAKKVFEREKTENYTLYAKTGWSSGENSKNGWFVGFVETKENVYYFATNVEPKGNRPKDEYYGARIEVTLSALKSLNILSETKKIKHTKIALSII